MEYILTHAIRALLDAENVSLLGLSRMLVDETYRDWVVEQVKDPVVKRYWTHEFAGYDPRFQREAIAPIQNKIGSFLAHPALRNMLGQMRCKIDVRKIMDQRGILIVNLSKGLLGEDPANLLGSLLVSRIQFEALRRAEIPESDRVDFHLCIDEFQNVTTDAFVGILSEARKYRLSLTLAHQYLEQLPEPILPAILGNVGSMISFSTGYGDARRLAPEFGEVAPSTLVDLHRYEVVARLLKEGSLSVPMVGKTCLSPVDIRMSSVIIRNRTSDPGLLILGWSVLLIGLVLSWGARWLFLPIFPLFSAALVCALVATAKGRPLGGIILMLVVLGCTNMKMNALFPALFSGFLAPAEVSEEEQTPRDSAIFRLPQRSLPPLPDPDMERIQNLLTQDLSAARAESLDTHAFMYDPADLRLNHEDTDWLTLSETHRLTRIWEVAGAGVPGRPGGVELGVSADSDRDHSVLYGYDDAGRLGAVTDPVRTWTYSYLPQSNLRHTADNGVVQQKYEWRPGRDVVHQVINKRVVQGDVFSQYEYRYDNLHRRTHQIRSGPVFGLVDYYVSYDYDDFSQVTSADRFAGADPDNPGVLLPDDGREYVFDAIGNRDQITNGPDAILPEVIDYTATRQYITAFLLLFMLVMH